MGNRRNRIIACRTVIEEMKPHMDPEVECLSLDPGLHLNPEKMRDSLQEMINDITADTENIILGYGLCSMGVIGLKASYSVLVVPRLDDCIAIFLGSREAYCNVLNREPGTYFLSRGWIEAGITPLDELKAMEERHGKALAHRLMKLMLKNYKCLTYVDMGGEGQERYLEFSREAARLLELEYQQLHGSVTFLKKLAIGPWDDEFIVAPPGHTIRLEDFELSSLKCGEDVSPA